MTTLKTSITLLSLFLTLSIFSQGTIPNQDFEAWVNSTSPKNWQSTTQLLPPGFITCQRTDSSHTGSFAIELTTIDLDGWAVPGVITLGTVGIGYTEGGIEFTDKPESLKGFIRHPSSGDQVKVIVQFYNNGNVIGGGAFMTTDSIPGYQEFTAPISYTSSLAPDTMNITILTDMEIPGSTMTIDGLHFQYTTTNTGHNNEKSSLNIHPNPCNNQLYMNTPPGESYEASIYDLNGRTVASQAETGKNSLNTSGIPSGTYLLVVKMQNNIYRQKFIKQ